MTRPRYPLKNNAFESIGFYIVGRPVCMWMDGGLSRSWPVQNGAGCPALRGFPNAASPSGGLSTTRTVLAPKGVG
jgi:hypothetical protein